MPRLTKSAPTYRKHRASGQAVVTLDGKDYYLGPYRSKASRIEYDRLVGEWQANGRRMPLEATDITVSEIAAAYWKWAQSYYRKNGRPTGEQAGIKAALRPLRGLYGATRATDFGPLALRAVRQRLVDSGNSRGYVNQNVGRRMGSDLVICFSVAVRKDYRPELILPGRKGVGSRF